MKIKILSESPEETQKIASFYIKHILKSKRLVTKRALVISLEGSLGSGKTEFLKGIAKALKLKEKVFSPTFIIMKRFKINHKFIKFLWHMDCYRLKSISDLKELGFHELINDPHNLIFIEWGDKIKRALPPEHLILKFHIIGNNKRKIELMI